MELGKHVKGEKGGKCSDRISSLPDELLGDILSCLPTTCAVSTCVLSKRWRCLFTLTNCLSFDDATWNDGPIEVRLLREIEAAIAARESRFKKFVNNVLELHQVSPIKKFSLVCRRRCDGSHLNAWITSAVQKGVQDLHCQLSFQRDVLPDCVFMCQRLAKLKMTGSFHWKYYLKTPLSVWLPNLMVLRLDYVTFSDGHSVERLFAGCKMLQELTLVWCDCDTRSQIIISSSLLKILTILTCYFGPGLFKIDSPNLVCLSYKDNSAMKIVTSRKDSFSLAKADLRFCCKAEVEYNFDSLQYYSAFIKATADKIAELHLTTETLKLVLAPTDHEEMLNFRSLSRFHLCNCPFETWKSVTSLLEKSPQLEIVTFQQCTYSRTRRRGLDVTPPNEDLTPFSCHAKVIEVYHFYGSEGSLVCLGHLLRNAEVLKRLILHCAYVTDYTRVRNALEMLRLLPRASEDCSIQLIGWRHNN